MFVTTRAITSINGYTQQGGDLRKTCVGWPGNDQLGSLGISGDLGRDL